MRRVFPPEELHRRPYSSPQAPAPAIAGTTHTGIHRSTVAAGDLRELTARYFNYFFFARTKEDDQYADISSELALLSS